MNSSIWPITLTDVITQAQSGPGSNGNEDLDPHHQMQFSVMPRKGKV